MTVHWLRRYAPLRFLTVFISELVLLTAPAGHAAPFAYISNYGTSGVGNTVSVLDTATDTVTATVPVGNRPYGVAVTPDGARVYVANQFSDTVSVISTATNTVVATVAVGSRPFGVAVTPDGARVYVANFFGASVSVISTATNTVTATVSLGAGSTPAGVAITPDGTQVYVANAASVSTTVSVISTATNTVTATVPVGGIPYGMAVTPDGARVYVANSLSNTTSVISTASNTAIATVGVGFTPFGVAVTPDGMRVYVTNYNNANVSVISTATNTVIATVAVGMLPAGVAVTPDGARVYVTNSDNADVSVISTATNTVNATVPVGIGPRGVGLFITPAVACATPPSGMAAWYPLNELAGAAAINDIAPLPSSTVNNVGTPKPGPVSPIGPPPAGPAPVAGQVGAALYFYGPNVEVASNSELDFSTGDFSVDAGVTAFSIDAWVRIVQVGPTLIQPIVDKFSSPGGPGFAFYIRNQRLELNLNGNTFVSTGPQIAFANPIANTGPWYHVAVTVQGGGRLGQGIFYVNGASAGTFTPSAGTANNNLPLWIGETRISGPRGEIAIDELELFNRALSQLEIQAIVNAGSAGKCRLSTVTEFYHRPFDHYFITAYPQETSSLAAGNLPPWVPTGKTFKVWGAQGTNITNVWRFFSASFAPKSSHFYTNNPSEAQSLLTGNVWSLEASDAFYMMAAPAGICPAGTIPLYRLYNNGQGSAPNHRYTTDPTVRSSMIAAHWIPEGNGADGVFACVPP